MEIWKPCVGYEGFYEVSNEGRVRSLAVWSYMCQRILQRKKPLIKSQDTTVEGYKRVLLSLYGVHKHCAVHRLVAMAFIPNSENLPEVNHKDENPSNNHLENLEWCSRKYNANYGTLPNRISIRSINASKSSKAVNQYTLDGVFLNTYPSLNEAARQLGTITGDMIGRACKGKAKTAGGYLWSFK
jgi:hypothetical protein